jgi:hypothetical protein
MGEQFRYLVVIVSSVTGVHDGGLVIRIPTVATKLLLLKTMQTFTGAHISF